MFVIHYPLWKITILMGKSTVSTAIFNSKLLVYQSVIFGYNLHNLELPEVGMLPV